MKSTLLVFASALVGLVLAQGAALARQGEASGARPFEYVRMTTAKGDILLELNREKAPITVENFVEYVNSGFFDGTIFHRVMPNFVIQGGGFLPDMTQKKTRDPIKSEWQNGLKNFRGTISMARMPGQPDSATSQFFINLVDNASLDMNRDGAAYAVFGRVVEGMDVVDAIRAVQTTNKGMHQNVPTEPVLIEKVTLITDESQLSDLKAKAKEMEKEAAQRAENQSLQVVQPGIDYIRKQGVDTAGGALSPTGLWTLDSVVGTGAQPKPTDKVEVHYTGWLTDGTKFDSSRDRGQTITFGLNGVIKGWTEGVGGMKEGGKRWLVIPSGLGYGARGTPGGPIPPNSTLVFEVELIKVNP